jgi:hypothetical protein
VGPDWGNSWGVDNSEGSPADVNATLATNGTLRVEQKLARLGRGYEPCTLSDRQGLRSSGVSRRPVPPARSRRVPPAPPDKRPAAPGGECLPGSVRRLTQP